MFSAMLLHFAIIFVIHLLPLLHGGLWMSISVCRCVSLLIFLSVSVCVWEEGRLCLCLSVCLPACIGSSACLLVCLFMCVRVCMSASVSQSICKFSLIISSPLTLKVLLIRSWEWLTARYLWHASLVPRVDCSDGVDTVHLQVQRQLPVVNLPRKSTL